MNKPIVTNNKPVAVDLKTGEEYYFCTCGKSGNQPFCDGTHVKIPEDKAGGRVRCTRNGRLSSN